MTQGESYKSKQQASPAMEYLPFHLANHLHQVIYIEIRKVFLTESFRRVMENLHRMQSSCS
jgi:hypothetical protein